MCNPWNHRDLRKLGSVVAGNSLGETKFIKPESTVRKTVVRSGFSASLARGSHSAPSGTTERHTLRQ